MNRLERMIGATMLAVTFVSCTESSPPESVGVTAQPIKESPNDAKANTAKMVWLYPYGITVLPGDSLWGLTEEILGEGKGMYWKQVLFDDNKRDEELRKFAGNKNTERYVFSDDSDLTRDLRPGQRLRVYLPSNIIDSYSASHPERELKPRYNKGDLVINRIMINR